MDIRDILFHNISQIIPPAFGLDLSDLSLKIIHLKKYKKEIKLEEFSREEIPKGVIKEGEIKKKEELVKIIKKALKGDKLKRIKTKYVICSLPEQHAFVQVIQLPKMKLSEAKEAVKWEAEANIPMSIDEVYFDWQIVKPTTDHLDVLINAVPKKLVNDYIDVLKASGLKPLVLEVESMATVRSLIRGGINNKPVLIIDLGATRTSFIIFAGHALRFTTNISVSNQKMIENISTKLKITRQEAKQLKFKCGLSRDKEDGKIFDVLLPDINKLIEEIRKYIVFHKDHAAPHEHGSDSEISKILLCGGGANLDGLPQFLSSQLKLQVVRGNPWVNILKSPLREIPDLSYEESLAYSTVFGLALRGISKH